jgi:hypothetical protein
LAIVRVRVSAMSNPTSVRRSISVSLLARTASLVKVACQSPMRRFQAPPSDMVSVLRRRSRVETSPAIERRPESEVLSSREALALALIEEPFSVFARA